MYLRLAIVALALTLWQCNPNRNKPTPTELTIQYVKRLQPQLVGTWQLRQVQIDPKKLISGYTPTGITKDTTLQNVATLTLAPWTGNTFDARVLDLEGTLRFRNYDYPIQAKLYPFQNGTKTVGRLFIDFYFKPGASTGPADYDYLRSIGLVGDNFDVETGIGEPTMTWRGLNRAVVSARFSK